MVKVVELWKVHLDGQLESGAVERKVFLQIVVCFKLRSSDLIPIEQIYTLPIAGTHKSCIVHIFSIYLLRSEANMTCSQLQKVETNVHIQASAEQFYDVLCNRTHHIANIFPEKIQSVEIHNGEWGTEGSIISWNYSLEGKACVSKEVVEGIDRENNKMTFKVIEGDLLGHYKSFKFIMQVTPKEKGSCAHWVLEYEKQKDHIPDPHTLLELTVEMSKEIGAYLTQDHK
ncbi:MLP protein 43 [Spatholobus suberectus]|nr:MLP protein 43 [Spatholobus suberectus]